MILKEELIKHKWKYIQARDIWSKLCVSFSNTDKTLDHFIISYADCLASTASSSSIKALERDVKRGAKIIFSNKNFCDILTIKQKRTLKNWIL